MEESRYKRNVAPSSFLQDVPLSHCRYLRLSRPLLLPTRPYQHPQTHSSVQSDETLLVLMSFVGSDLLAVMAPGMMRVLQVAMMVNASDHPRR